MTDTTAYLLIALSAVGFITVPVVWCWFALAYVAEGKIKERRK